MNQKDNPQIVGLSGDDFGGIGTDLIFSVDDEMYLGKLRYIEKDNETMVVKVLWSQEDSPHVGRSIKIDYQQVEGIRKGNSYRGDTKIKIA